MKFYTNLRARLTPKAELPHNTGQRPARAGGERRRPPRGGGGRALPVSQSETGPCFANGSRDAASPMAPHPALPLYDTTLRPTGSKTKAVAFPPVPEKHQIAAIFEQAWHRPTYEGGWPGWPTRPIPSFRHAAQNKSTTYLIALGAIPDRDIGLDASRELQSLLTAIHISILSLCVLVAKRRLPRHPCAGITAGREHDNIRVSVIHCTAQKRETISDAEHFFDGYKANPDYALRAIHAAHDAGARWIVLCDTNGGTLPSEIRTITEAVIASGIPVRPAWAFIAIDRHRATSGGLHLWRLLTAGARADPRHRLTGWGSGAGMPR